MLPCKETNHTIREDAVSCQKTLFREKVAVFLFTESNDPTIQDMPATLFTTLSSFKRNKRWSLPIFTTGQFRLHSCPHFLGLHLSSSTTATRINLCAISGEGQTKGRGGRDGLGRAVAFVSEPRPTRAILYEYRRNQLWKIGSYH